MKINDIENYLKQNQIKKTPPLMDNQKPKSMWTIQQEVMNNERKI